MQVIGGQRGIPSELAMDLVQHELEGNDTDEIKRSLRQPQ